MGGGEIALINLVRHLDRRRVTPIVLLFADGPLAERLRGHVETHLIPLADSVAQAKKDGLGWNSLLKAKSAWLIMLQIWKVSRFAQRHEVDLIHTNSLKADIIGGLAARLAGIPLIWHVRDRIDFDYLPGSVVRLFRFLCRTLPNFVIANSASTLATLELEGRNRGAAIASGVETSTMIRVVHDGCRVEPNQNERSNLLSPVRVGLIGRISPWKGQDIFIEAAARLHRRHPRVRFEIIGAPLFSERNFEAQLHELCDSLNLKDVVEFAGFVEDIPARIAQLDIVVHASKTGEPFGQVIIEGMAAEKPVVATNGGGVPEIVEHCVTGLLVPMGDAQSMADAIEYLLKNPQEAAAMGVRGRQRVQEKFTIQKTARMVENVYREVLATY
jgi:glycosyltransferase involved in cell wall biosynthesis